MIKKLNMFTEKIILRVQCFEFFDQGLLQVGCQLCISFEGAYKHEYHCCSVLSSIVKMTFL